MPRSPSKEGSGRKTARAYIPSFSGRVKSTTIPLPGALLNQIATVRRRASTGRDSLNNPDYGFPTGGLGWSTVYNNIAIRLAFSSKPIRFAQEGERVQPTGIIYLNTGPIIKPEDRVLITEGSQVIEYTVISVIYAKAFGPETDHLELVVQLP